MSLNEINIRVVNNDFGEDSSYETESIKCYKLLARFREARKYLNNSSDVGLCSFWNDVAKYVSIPH